MSLTAEINRVKSPFGAWMRRTLPHTKENLRQVDPELNGHSTLCLLPKGTQPAHHISDGTVLNYRLRFVEEPTAARPRKVQTQAGISTRRQRRIRALKLRWQAHRKAWLLWGFLLGLAVFGFLMVEGTL